MRTYLSNLRPHCENFAHNMYSFLSGEPLSEGSNNGVNVQSEQRDQHGAALCCKFTTSGISEKVIDGVAVQHVERRMVQCAEHSDFTWCNTNNHRDTDEFRKLSGRGDDWYVDGIEQTRMERWAGALADLCGERMRDAITFTVTPELQQIFFKPAAGLAAVGARAARLLREEAEDLATEVQSSCDFPAPPVGGWFVRTSACSPKDAFRDGGAVPHHSLVDALLALLASDRIHKAMRAYNENVVVYLLPFDSSVTTERELRVFVHEREVTAMSTIAPNRLVSLPGWITKNSQL